MSARLPALIVLMLIGISPRAAAQPNYYAQLPECEARSLYWDTDTAGALDTSDCKAYVEGRGLLRAEYWDMALTAGDRVVVTMQRGTMQEPFIIMHTLGFVRIAAADDELSPGVARLVFEAPYTGVHRAVVSSSLKEQTPDLGTYTIRIARLTVPIPQEFYQPTAVGSQVTLWWAPALSPTSILEYVVSVGSRPGASDLGEYPVGLATQVVASAGPGVYYIRIAARNSLGRGPDSLERVLRVGPQLTAPQAFAVTMVGRRATFTWLPPATGGVTSYELLVASTPGAADLAIFNLGNVTAFVVDNVPLGAYYVRVRALNASGPGVESAELVVLVF